MPDTKKKPFTILGFRWQWILLILVLAIGVYLVYDNPVHDDTPPSGGWVQAKATFNTAGSVTVTVKLGAPEESSLGDDGKYEVWFGEGTEPAKADLPPPSGDRVISTPAADVHFAVTPDPTGARSIGGGDGTCWCVVRLDMEGTGGVRAPERWYRATTTRSLWSGFQDLSRYP